MSEVKRLVMVGVAAHGLLPAAGQDDDRKYVLTFSRAALGNVVKLPECIARECIVDLALNHKIDIGPPASWQPIATAPKDATKIDLWLHIYASPRSMGWADSFRVTEAWWQESTKQWVHSHEGKAEPLYTDYVTHWMPLPEGPEQRA